MTSNFTYPNRLFCHWTLAPRSQRGTLKLSVDELFLESTGCHDSLKYVRGQDLQSGTLLKQLCGNHLDQSPTVVLSPGYDSTHVVFKSDYAISNRGFNISYSYNDCGGTFHGPVHEIRSSGSDMDCVWLLDFEEGQQIVLSRFSVNMENSDTVTCGQRGASYFTIKNGGTYKLSRFVIKLD